jgi:DNA-binding transcriptional MocR family regulator
MVNMQRVAQIAGIVSLAYAEPDPALYPAEEFWRVVEGLASDSRTLTQMLSYSTPQGDEGLRIELSSLLRERGIAPSPADVVLTTGVSQGISLAATCLGALNGAVVVVEEPTYLGMLHVLTAFGARPVGVPLDGEGLRLDILEQVIQQHQPKFLYTVSNFQNPTGACMSKARRRELIALAGRYRLVIVEDDTYGLLNYDDLDTTPLKALDDHELVIYLGGTSKILMPGLRIGYMVPPAWLRERMLSTRQAFDLGGPPLLQRALASYIHKGKLKANVRRIMPHYRERRDAMMQALRLYMPGDVTWTQPGGGFSVWVTVRSLTAHDSGGLYQAALRHKVAFTPGETFLTTPGEYLNMRLCFSSTTPERIREGVMALADLIRAGTRLPRLRGATHDLPLV